VRDIPNDAKTALEAFSACPGWEQRARLLMQWGDQLAPLSDAERCETNRVQGCESQVWLLAERDGAHWQFRASSDARLLRGLLALLLARVNGLAQAELAQLDLPDWFSQLGLARHLSPSRSNGLQAVLTRMQHLLDADAQGAAGTTR
jgi:cysteine desulfuration protein SufE